MTDASESPEWRNKKREKEGPPGSGKDERLLGITLFTIYYSYFSLNYTEQTHLAIKQKGT